MKPYEFMRFYHPKLGRFVYKHKGSGIIVDNIFKPMKSAVSSIFKKFAKPVAKKSIRIRNKKYSVNDLVKRYLRNQVI